KRVIINDENGSLTDGEWCALLTGIGDAECHRQFMRGGWEKDSDRRPHARIRFDPHTAPVTARDSQDGGQPEAAAGRLRREERIKDSGTYLGGHSAARVGHFD